MALAHAARSIAVARLLSVQTSAVVGLPLTRRRFCQSSAQISGHDAAATLAAEPVEGTHGVDASDHGSRLQYGEFVALRGANDRDRRYAFVLREGGKHNVPNGLVQHSDVVGLEAGSAVLTTKGDKTYYASRLTLEEYILDHMKRGPTPTYPKDAIAMAHMLDVAPGMKVLEAGSGSGSLSLYLSRAVGPKGRVVSFDVREDHSRQAQENYRKWVSANRHRGFETENVEFVVDDLSSPTEESKGLLQPASFDAVALDMMEPWHAMRTVADVLKPERSVVLYLPNASQVLSLLESVHEERLPFAIVRSLEVLHRRWNFGIAKGKSLESSGSETESAPRQEKAVRFLARPEHEQEPHTAFLVQLRRLFGDQPPILDSIYGRRSRR